MFPRPEIQERLARFVLCKLWINDPDPEAGSAAWRRLLEERFGTSAIPLYVTLRADGATVGTLDFPGGSVDAFARRLAAFLDEALAE